MNQERSGGAAGPMSTFMPQNIDAHPVEFTGSGGEYFRVWIVNVLLSIVTLGIYTPWARRRTAQYFYSHTLVAGSPLEFTAQQRKMVMGFVMLMLLTIAYNIAVRTGQDTAVGLFLLTGAALAPFIWASAMRFRLAATRWRGLRLQFTASWKEVYIASWPVFALALVWFGVFFGMQMLSPDLAQALYRIGIMHAGGQRVDAGHIDEDARAVFLEIDLAGMIRFEIGDEIADLAQRWRHGQGISRHRLQEQRQSSL